LIFIPSYYKDGTKDGTDVGKDVFLARRIENQEPNAGQDEGQARWTIAKMDAG
jgi:hypothetical protein